MTSGQMVCQLRHGPVESALHADFTCPDTLAANHLNRAVTGPGEVANEGNEAECKKTAKYAELTNRYQFVPIYSHRDTGASRCGGNGVFPGARSSDVCHQSRATFWFGLIHFTSVSAR